MACDNIIEGKLHVCSRYAFGTVLGAIPSKEEDYVDLLDESKTPSQVREKIDQLLNNTKCVTSCDYCNAKHASIEESAIQTRKVLQFKKEVNKL